MGNTRSSGSGLDPIGWFIATTHQLLGHDKTAAVIGAPAGDKAACIICQYERDPSAERRQAVIDMLSSCERGVTGG